MTSCANSEVSPEESVAVAEMASPELTTVGKLAEKLALPLESVVTVVVPISVWPWP